MREKDLFIPADAGVSEITGAREDLAKVYYLHDTYERFLMSFTGLGMPPIFYISQRGPQQHGETYLDFRLQERKMQFIHRRTAACSRTEYWANRAELINALRPNRGTVDTFGLGRYRKILPDGSKRDIDCTIERGPTFSARNPQKWDEWAFTEALRLVAPDPTFYDPARVDVSWEVEVYDGLIFFEATSYPGHLTFPNNALFGTDIISGSVNVAYTGTWFAYPVITITGPISSPSIQNVTLNTKIQLDYDVSAGEIVTIETAYGNKRIYSNFSTNLIGTKTDDSDLNLYIAPSPIAENGINVFQASGGNGTTASNITMSYYTRYIGI